MKIDLGVYTPSLRENRLLGFKFIVILEQACVELVHVEKGQHALLDGRKHHKLLTRSGRVATNDQRPDIAYQCLCALLQSPLNAAGMLLIYIRTQQNLLIEVNPQLACPKSFHEFESLMATLLVRKSIRAKNVNVTLLRIIKNDLEELLPPHSKKIGLEVSGEAVSDLANFMKTQIGCEAASKRQAVIHDHLEAVSNASPLVFFIGAVAHGSPASKATCPFVEQEIKLGDRPLTAAQVCHEICAAAERYLQVG